MAGVASMAEMASLVGEPARAAMLQSLMDGRALTAGELAITAGVTPQTASGHLSTLVSARLVSVLQQGRHRYHCLAAPQVARLLESLMLVASVNLAPRTGPRDAALRLARICYDHIAGRLGVALADAMAKRGLVELDDGAAIVTGAGMAFFEKLGMGIEKTVKPGALPLCRVCLDWSERRTHFSGRLGIELCRHSLAGGWVNRRQGSRALEITPKGYSAYRELFGISFACEDTSAATSASSA